MTSQDLDVLDEADCFLLLRSRTLGRVGVHIADDLTIFPVYYAVMDKDVVFRTSPGTKLNAALLGTRVVFEVDNASPGWSVVVRGHAHEVRELAEIDHAANPARHRLAGRHPRELRPGRRRAGDRATPAPTLTSDRRTRAAWRRYAR